MDKSLPALTVGTVNFAVFFVYLGALFATLVVFIREYDLGVFGFGPQGSSGIFMAITVIAAGVFMFVGATNFVILYALTQGRTRPLRESEEFRFYALLVGGVAGLSAIILAVDGEFSGIEPTLRHALFQAVSILTTTGYATVDFNLWSPAVKHVLFLCMFVGGMAGSTTCSIKTFRWLVVLKSFRRELFTELHPEAIRPVRLGGEIVDEETVHDTTMYILLSIVIFVLLTVIVVVDSTRAGLGVGEFDAMSAAASTFLNIGPAFGAAGPYGSYAHFPTVSKTAMVLLMWVGRIEIIPVLVLLTPRFWRS